MVATLYAINISHYCEAARWALQSAGKDYDEITVMPGYHLLRLPIPPVSEDGTKGGKPTTPFMKLGNGSWLIGSDAIVNHCGLSGEQLSEKDHELAQELGVRVRAIAYSYLLAKDSTALEYIAEQMPIGQRLFWWIASDRVKERISKGYVRSDEYIAESKFRLAAVRAHFEQRLGLVGDGKAEILDLSPLAIMIASLFAPMVNAPGYGAGNGYFTFPPNEALPINFQEVVKESRDTKLGAWTLKFYAKHR